SWARDFAKGGACYTTHLYPYVRNIERLKRAGVSRLIVHVRDPRQRLLSMIHHVERYSDAYLGLKQNAFADALIVEKIEGLMSFYLHSIWWLQGWVEAEESLEILFSTYEDFVRDRNAFVDRYIQFYGGPIQHFREDHALTLHEGTDYHYR